MKSILVILLHLLLFLITRGKRQYLVEVAENASLQEEHHGNKTKHYLVEVSKNTSLPRKHLGNKEGKKRRGKKMERKRKGDKKRDYQDIHGVRLFARRTFTTPKIRTFTTPKFGHFPPPKKTFARRTTAIPIFFLFFGALFLAFST